MAETIYSDKRVPNGEFLILISRGDIEAVTNYLTAFESTLTSSKSLCLSVAVQFNQGAILQVLLDNALLKPDSVEQTALLEKSVSPKKWISFQTLLDHDHCDPCVNDWKILCIISESWEHKGSNHDLLKEFTSKERVRQLMDQHQQWDYFLEKAIHYSDLGMLEFALNQDGTSINVNAPQVIRAAMSVFFSSEDFCGTLDLLSRHNSFEPVIDEDPRILLKVMERDRKYLASFLLSKKQRFFSVPFRQRAFDEGCRLRYSCSAFLAQHPEIVVSHKQTKTLEFSFMAIKD
ncbi:hypothetical protein HDU81_002095 [Chytriomyces hyalinus]|nr:hypothetical protein HDU81_002095 [Chytriomyces hyalinus]